MKRAKKLSLRTIYPPNITKKLLQIASRREKCQALWEPHDPRHLKVPLHKDDPIELPRDQVRALRSMSASLGSSLAFLRVERDNLEKEAESLALQEAELASAFELCEYIRDESLSKYTDIQQKLLVFEASLLQIEVELKNTTNHELRAAIEERRRRTLHIIEHEFRVLLLQLEHSINVNRAKVGKIEKKLSVVQSERRSVLDKLEEKETALSQLIDVVTELKKPRPDPSLEKTLAA